MSVSPANPPTIAPAKAERYDVFISYRRAGGSDLAQLLNLALQSRGYRVFLDVQKMPSGTFSQSLMRMIDSSRNVVVLLTKGCLETREGSEDWFRKEIGHALASSANVVPLRVSGFVSPEKSSLSPEIATLLMRHGPSYIHEFSDASLEHLCKLLDTRPRRWRRAVFPLIAAMAILLTAAIVFRHHLGFFSASDEPKATGSGTVAADAKSAASPRLTVYQLDQGGARIPLDISNSPLPAGTQLTLDPENARNKTLYVLEINGQGEASLFDSQRLDDVHWGWAIEGPPASETLLLLSCDHPLTEAQRHALTASINELKLSPQVALQTEVVWGDGNAHTVVSPHPRGPRDVVNEDWQQQVLRVLKRTDGVAFSGFSVATQAKP